MALEDILNIGKSHRLISGISDQLNKNPTDSGVLNGFLMYKSVKGPEPIGQAGLQIMNEHYRSRQMDLGDDIKQSKQEETGALIGAVKAEYENVVNALKEAHMQHLALEMPDEKKLYLALKEAIKAEDFETAKMIYANTYKNEEWRKFMLKYGDTDFVKRHRDRYVELEMQRFMVENLSDEEEREGKKVKVYSPKKAKEYVLASPRRLGDNENIAYLEVGKVYTNQGLAEESKQEMKEQLKQKTVKELRELAKEAGIKNYSKMKKDDLINALIG